MSLDGKHETQINLTEWGVKLPYYRIEAGEQSLCVLEKLLLLQQLQILPYGAFLDVRNLTLAIADSCLKWNIALLIRPPSTLLDCV